MYRVSSQYADTCQQSAHAPPPASRSNPHAPRAFAHAPHIQAAHAHSGCTRTTHTIRKLHTHTLDVRAPPTPSARSARSHHPHHPHAPRAHTSAHTRTTRTPIAAHAHSGPGTHHPHHPQHSLRARTHASLITLGCMQFAVVGLGSEKGSARRADQPLSASDKPVRKPLEHAGRSHADLCRGTSLPSPSQAFRSPPCR